MKMKHWLIGGGIAAAAVLAIHAASLKVHAADLGGNCCADLEERIAELESTVTRKGNRKVKLTISGEISKAVLFTDGLGLPSDNKLRVIDNGNSGSKIRLTGEATINPTTKVGFIYEFGVDETRGMGLGPVVGPLVHWLDGDVALRKSAAWVETAVGKVTIGKDSVATDGITELDTSNTSIASRMLSVEPIWSYLGLSGLPLVGGNTLNPAPFHDLRAEVLKYESPSMAGFKVSASWGGGQTLSGDDLWDVALRYAGETAGFRFVAGAGYRVEKLAAFSLNEQKTISGSASVKHMISGLFATFAAADQKDNPIYGRINMWHGKVGIEKNFFGPGETSAYFEYAEHELKDLGVNSSFWGVGAVQNIDIAATDLFISVRQYKSDILSGDATVGLAGFRIKY